VSGIYGRRSVIVFMILAALSLGCAGKGLLTESGAPDSYEVPKLLDDQGLDTNPTFIVYGDNRPGWRVVEKFARQENWKTWKMLLVPFYEVYWLGNGFVGAFNWLRHTPDAKIREGLLVRDAIYAQAAASQVDFILNTGDMPTDGRRPDHWGRFIKDYKYDVPVMIEFPYLPTIGNHERANDPVHGRSNYDTVFQYPPFYRIDFPDAALFVLDSNLIIDQYRLIDDEDQEELFRKWFVSDDSGAPSWLERELSSCEQAFKIVSIHHPPISFGKHHGNWSDPGSGTGNVEKRRKLIRLLQDQGVQVVFSGHEHLYEHSTVGLASASDAGAKPVHMIVTGGGGAPLRGKKDSETIREFHENYRSEGLDVELLRQAQVHHYCLAELDVSEIRIGVHEVTDDPAQPTRLLEEFSIRR
jgi:hypothetical protein